MFSPIAPLFASECWSKFISVTNRLDTENTRLNWDKDVLQQRWPDVDKNIGDIAVIRVNRYHSNLYKQN